MFPAGAPANSFSLGEFICQGCSASDFSRFFYALPELARHAQWARSAHGRGRVTPSETRAGG